MTPTRREFTAGMAGFALSAHALGADPAAAEPTEPGAADQLMTARPHFASDEDFAMFMAAVADAYLVAAAELRERANELLYPEG